MAVFAKKDDESYQEYRDRAINVVSPSFCGAKWYNASIWLGNGTNASCHHPPAHKIPLEELEKSYKAIHNTQYKKELRKQMLNGERPKECEYCWRIEDLGADKVSDRVFKSMLYTDEELQQCKTELGYEKDVDLKTLEIAFDSNCNFACSYCNSYFSTNWMVDMKKNGPYQNLVTHEKYTYQLDGSHSLPYGKDNTNNPYLNAFWKWWEGELQYSLRELRVSGGEPTMSKDYWKLTEWFKNNPDCNVEFAVNTNLGHEEPMFNKFLESTKYFKTMHIYTSMESVGKHAEYIRDGLVYDRWIHNMERLMSEGNIKSMNIMMTINALCIFSLTDFLDKVLEWKQKYKLPIHISANILRFPSFQSIITLPKRIRADRAEHLQNWIDKTLKNPNHKMFLFEIDSLLRLIDYVRDVEQGHAHGADKDDREANFKSFYSQYDIRRNKNFEETFPDIARWYNRLRPKSTPFLEKCYEGDANTMNPYYNEVMESIKSFKK